LFRQKGPYGGVEALRVTAKGNQLIGSPPKNQDVIRRFTWVVASINVHLDELRDFWAEALGISGSQYMILMALVDLDKGDGVPVNAVSKKLHADASFVTTHSKRLEKKGASTPEDLRRGRPGRQDVADRQKP
jgi:hypothetical protein